MYDALFFFKKTPSPAAPVVQSLSSCFAWMKLAVMAHFTSGLMPGAALWKSVNNALGRIEFEERAELKGVLKEAFLVTAESGMLVVEAALVCMTEDW